MEKYQDILTIIGPPGLIPIVGANVTVYDFGTSSNAAIYSSNSTSAPATNPLTTDNSGRFSFYAPDGRYTLSMSGTSIQTTVLTDIQLFDGASTAVPNFSSLVIGSNTDGGTIVFPERTAGRGQQIISSFDLGPFLGDPDPVIFIGYNKTQTNNAAVTSEPSAAMSIEGFYNDGSGQPKMEMHWQFDGLTGQGAEVRRPLFAIANRATSAIEVQIGANTVVFGDNSLTTTVAQVLFTNVQSKEFLIGTNTVIGVPGFNGVRVNGTTGAVYDMMVGGVREGAIYSDSSGVNILNIAGRPISFKIGAGFTEVMNLGSTTIAFFGASATTQANVSNVITTTGLSSTGAFGFSSAAAAQSMVDAVRFLQQALKRYGLSS